MKLAVKTAIGAIIISVGGVTACAGAQTLPKAAKLVPPETVALVEIDNFSQLRSQFEKTSLYKFYKDPAMARFFENAKTKWRQKIREQDNAVIEAVFAADVLPQGRVAFALVLNPKALNAKEPQELFIIQWGQNLSKIKEAVDKTVKEATEEGLRQRSEDYRGVSIKTIFKENPAKPGYDSSSKLNYCFVDDCLIGCDDIEILRFVIAQLKGAGSDTLADDSDYTGAIRAVGPYHDIDIYINIKQYIKTILAEDPIGVAQMILTVLGFDNISAFGCSVGLGRYSGSSYCAKASLRIDGAKKGICKMLETESAAIKAPRFVPASACSATFLNLSIKKAYAELDNLLSCFLPNYAAKIDGPLAGSDSQGQPQVRLKSDIIEHLGSEIVVTQHIKKPFSKSSGAQYLVALAVDNRRALEKSVSLWHSRQIAPNNPDSSRELLGHTIYIIEGQSLPFMPGGNLPLRTVGQPSAGQMSKAALTITDTHLIFGTEATVEQSIRALVSKEVESLASAGWFNSAKVTIPSVVGLACLKDDAASGELAWWTIKNGRTRDLIKLQFGPVALGELVDPALLPQFDSVRKYFGFSTFYGLSRPDGFFFEFRDNNSTAGN